MADDRKRVKFTGECINEDDIEKDVIQAQTLSDNVYTVKLGYIKIYHRYRVNFSLPNDVFLNTSFSKLEREEDDNPRCTFIKYLDLPTGYIEVELYADTERTFEERMVLHASHKKSQSTKEVSIIFLASVFGKHEGTPRLKRGLKCIGYDDLDSSSSSETDLHN